MNVIRCGLNSASKEAHLSSYSLEQPVFLLHSMMIREEIHAACTDASLFPCLLSALNDGNSVNFFVTHGITVIIVVLACQSLMPGVCP